MTHPTCGECGSPLFFVGGKAFCTKTRGGCSMIERDQMAEVRATAIPCVLEGK